MRTHPVLGNRVDPRLAHEPPSEQARCRGEKDGFRFRFPGGASQGGVDVLDEVGVFHVARLETTSPHACIAMSSDAPRQMATASSGDAEASAC